MCLTRTARTTVLAAGYANAVLTPNGIEFKRLAGKLGVDPESPRALQELAARWEAGVVIWWRGGASGSLIEVPGAGLMCWPWRRLQWGRSVGEAEHHSISLC